MFQQVFQQGEFSSGIVITFQVMAFTGMSPGNPYGIRPLPKTRQDEFSTHAAGTWNSDDPDIRWILHPADTGQVGGAIATPIA